MSKIQSISVELLNDTIVPAMSISRIKVLFFNHDIIEFIKSVLTNYKSIDDQRYSLIKLKKLLTQVPRYPDPSEYRTNREFFDNIETEQRLYDPIRWIEAELEYLNSNRASNIELKELLTEFDMLQIFGNRQTLNRRIVEGLPCARLGGVKVFSKRLVIQWIENKSKLEHV